MPLGGGYRRRLFLFSQNNMKIINAFVSAEDKKFYNHCRINLLAILNNSDVLPENIGPIIKFNVEVLFIFI